MNKTFENYIYSESSLMAYSSCKNISNKDSTNLIYIFGSSAMGKSHLAKATFNYIVENFQDKTAVITNSYELMSEMINHMKKNNIEAFYNQYNNYDVFIIDDFHEMKNKHGTQETFLRIIDHYVACNKKLIIFSSNSLDNLEGFDLKIINRLNSFLTIQLHPPDLKSKLVITKLKSEEIKFSLTPEEIKWPAFLCENVREIEGMLLKMKFYNEHKNNEIVR